MGEPATITVSVGAAGAVLGAAALYVMQHWNRLKEQSKPPESEQAPVPTNGTLAKLEEARKQADRANTRLDDLPCSTHSSDMTGLKHDLQALTLSIAEVKSEQRDFARRVEAKLDTLMTRKES